jgi:hypothetical protein
VAKALLPAAAAYGGVHQHLREVAATVSPRAAATREA